MTAPRLLDLFCGAGGAAMGYHRAGFEVVGVDIEPQPHYPFEFIQASWDEPLMVLPGLWEREGVDYVIHASPPCQAYSTMTKKWGRSEEHPDLVEPVREHLQLIGAPYVIENVVGAPLVDPLMLCGSMFGLGDNFGRQLRRHRVFESNVSLPRDLACAHRGRTVGVYGNPGGSSKRDGIVFAQFADWQVAMGIDWMNVHEISESIPPAYTEWIGRQLSEPVSLTLWDVPA